MAYLIHLTSSPNHHGTVRVLSDLDDRDAAIKEAERAFSLDRGVPASHIAKVVEASYAPLGSPEFMPEHDLYASDPLYSDEEASDVGNLMTTLRLTDVLVLTDSRGEEVRIYLHEIASRDRAMLRIEAPRSVRIRSQKATEVAS
jgi:hypothetical protein